ncbi:LysO family transporter [Clostridium botulinum]|nr:LysO family transporter [Clostridium botulinum]MCS4526846.1 LysO family transporter [Clostridium botulinum]
MWAILLFLFLGMLIGYFKEFSKRGKKINGILQQTGVFVLLFFMGASIGANKSVIKDIKNIGQVSIAFAITTTIFSIIILYIVSKRFLQKGRNN